MFAILTDIEYIQIFYNNTTKQSMSSDISKPHRQFMGNRLKTI